ncbi:MocR-like pyridoxine biosynthesis transcription factor PdxR [Deefgea rivuli]|uniref:MocR-like pyridoxine biosynthesis transcription factor PdxR n=1 Tax=Deefgea rivuli TaxID=400948 RepID=UPI00047F41E1|nr:PLP-dependent aminotransferase family protein [Deefgea rivuli]
MDYSLLLQGEPEQGAMSRQQRLYTALRAAILQGTLAADTRLPASRLLAQELGIARNSVIYAYEQLIAEGFLHADRRGTRVATLKMASAIGASAQPPQGLSRRGRAFATPFADVDTVQAFTPGVPSLADFPIARWQRCVAQSWQKVTPEKLAYGHSAGEPQLREAIAAHLRAGRGVVCDASQVFITDGTQNSLDLCAKLFADVGDIAWIENPGYGGAANAFATAQLQIKGIPVDLDGLAPQESDWQQHPPKLIYTTPSHQYPLGSVLSLARRLQLLANAKAVGALIIEDDYDSEFRRSGPPLPAIQGLAADAPVIYLGTFSKSLFPALRTGFIVVPRALADSVATMLAQCHPRGRQVEQIALAQFLHSGEFASHLRKMRRLYAARRDAMQDALHTHLGDIATLYGGASGMHLSIGIPSDFCDQRISDTALAQGLVARPLSAYVIGTPTPHSNGFILGYAQVPCEAMDAKIAQLARLIRMA